MSTETEEKKTELLLSPRLSSPSKKHKSHNSSSSSKRFDPALITFTTCNQQLKQLLKSQAQINEASFFKSIFPKNGKNGTNQNICLTGGTHHTVFRQSLNQLFAEAHSILIRSNHPKTPRRINHYFSENASVEEVETIIEQIFKELSNSKNKSTYNLVLRILNGTRIDNESKKIKKISQLLKLSTTPKSFTKLLQAFFNSKTNPKNETLKELIALTAAKCQKYLGLKAECQQKILNIRHKGKRKKKEKNNKKTQIKRQKSSNQPLKKEESLLDFCLAKIGSGKYYFYLLPDHPLEYPIFPFSPLRFQNSTPPPPINLRLIKYIPEEKYSDNNDIPLTFDLKEICHAYLTTYRERRFWGRFRTSDERGNQLAFLAALEDELNKEQHNNIPEDKKLLIKLGAVDFLIKYLERQTHWFSFKNGLEKILNNTFCNWMIQFADKYKKDDKADFETKKLCEWKHQMDQPRLKESFKTFINQHRTNFNKFTGLSDKDLLEKPYKFQSSVILPENPIKKSKHKNKKARVAEKIATTHFATLSKLTKRDLKAKTIKKADDSLLEKLLKKEKPLKKPSTWQCFCAFWAPKPTSNQWLEKVLAKSQPTFTFHPHM
jgi:hypothetical protein